MPQTAKSIGNYLAGVHDLSTNQTTGMKRLPSLLLILLLAIPASAQIPAGYHNFDAMTAEVTRLVKAHPNLARVSSIGKTLQGRDIWMVEVGNKSGAPMDVRPAVLVAANLEADQLVGSELVLGSLAHLLSTYASDEAVKSALDHQTFYFLPRLNPDGAERAFAGLKTGERTNTSAYDDDNDGRMDEDGYEDLNGDGMITLMRVADPKGLYMVDPDEPRLMKKADASKGEVGTHSIYWEGRDDDGDGFYNDDPPGGVDLNRNFQHEYPYYQVGAGIHMVSENEARALMDFVIAHRNIAMMVVYGESDNLITPPNDKGELGAAAGLDLRAFADASNEAAREVGVFRTSTRRFFGGGFGQSPPSTGGRPSSGQRPATTVNRDDLPYFTTVSEHYKEVTGLSAVPAIRKPAGAFFEYGYYQFGVPSFSTPGWAPAAASDSSATAAAPGGAARGARGGRSAGGSVDHRLLKWMDASGIDGFAAWTAYEHPQLGTVEIGGFKPYAAQNPPASMVQELGPKQGAFLAWLASQTAEVRIAHTEVTDEGGGIFRIKADVENGGFLPTSTAHGVRSRSVKPTMVQLGIPPENLLSGSAKTSFFQATDGSGRRQSFEWIIKGKRGDKVELRAVSQKGGSDTASLELR